MSHKNLQTKPKLLYIVESMGGGVFTYMVDMASRLIDMYDIYIAYGVREQTPQNIDNYFDERVHLIEVSNFTRSISGAKDIKAFFEIRQIVKKTQPDIVHLHSSKAGVLGRWAINGRKIPMFYTPHGYSFLMSDYSWLKRIVYKMIEVICAKRCCTTISCSEGEHKETLQFTKRAAYVDNGIDLDKLQSMLNEVGKQQEEHPFTVFTLGRICYQKNPELFNEIANAMPDVHFLWIGDGELRHLLTAQNIEITGWEERKEALKKSLSADVFLLPSLWEGLPISLLEAMYMKKVCVVSNVIGNRDVIQNKRNGFICNNVNEYVSALRYILEENTEGIIRQAYQDVQNKYNLTVMAEKYHHIYQTIGLKGMI